MGETAGTYAITPAATIDASGVDVTANYAITAVAGTLTISAPITYTVIYANYDGTPLQTISGLASGAATPSYTGATPTKPQTTEYTYTFNNTWSPAVAPTVTAATAGSHPANV